MRHRLTASSLHACCMRTACAGMRTASTLHPRCIHTACTPHPRYSLHPQEGVPDESKTEAAIGKCTRRLSETSAEEIAKVSSKG